MKRIPLMPLTSLAKLHFERAAGYAMPDVIANLELSDEAYRRVEYAAKQDRVTIQDLINEMFEKEPLLIRSIVRQMERENAARRRRRRWGR